MTGGAAAGFASCAKDGWQANTARPSGKKSLYIPYSPKTAVPDCKANGAPGPHHEIRGMTQLPA
jgi:hypothetical protein